MGYLNSKYLRSTYHPEEFLKVLDGIRWFRKCSFGCSLFDPGVQSLLGKAMKIIVVTSARTVIITVYPILQFSDCATWFMYQNSVVRISLDQNMFGLAVAVGEQSLQHVRILNTWTSALPSMTSPVFRHLLKIKLIMSKTRMKWFSTLLLREDPCLFYLLPVVLHW